MTHLNVSFKKNEEQKIDIVVPFDIHYDIKNSPLEKLIS